jgi:hypothetical protein
VGNHNAATLRRLGSHGGPLACVSGLLLSETALTDLALNVTTPKAVAFDPTQGSSLLPCLQRMPCLRNLDLTTPYLPQDYDQHLAPKNTTPVKINYHGPRTFLDHLVFGLSAPFLQDVLFSLYTSHPLPYLSRVIDDVREKFRSVSYE